MLNSEPEIYVIGQAGRGQETLDLIVKNKPDIAVLDISMPGLDGFEILQRIKSMGIETKVIFLTMHNDALTAKRAIQLNANGFVLKDNAFEDLLYAIRAVYSGGKFISPTISEVLFKDYSGEDKAPIILTLREREILKLIASGLTNRQIADRLFISVKTVETHRTNIMQKLDIHSLAELVKYAIKIGLIEK